jgi:hypothetical protein
MLQPHGSVIKGTITPPSTGHIIARFPIGVPGTLDRFDMQVETVNGSGPFTLDIHLNGVTVFADPGDRPTIAATANNASITFLDVIDVIRGDLIELIAAVVPVGGIGNSLMTVLSVDDGLPTAGPEGPQGIQGIQGDDGPEGPQGDPGPQGQGVLWRGQWDSATAYVSADIVKYFDETAYNETVWIALANNTNVTPPSDPTKWEKMIAQESAKLEAHEIVTTFYNGALHRAPDPTTELTPGVDALEGARQNALDFVDEMKAQGTAIFGLAEYIALGTTDAQYVLDLYDALLGRAPENMAAYDDWVDLVASDGRASVLTGFLNSQEFYQHRITRGFWYNLSGYDAGALMGVKMAGVLADGQTWVKSGGSLVPTDVSGGGLVPGVDGHADAPHTEDDEFEGNSLDPKWTVGSSTAATLYFNSICKSALIVELNGSSGLYSIRQPFTPGSADWSLSACYFIAPQANFESAELGIADSSTGYSKIVYGYDGNPVIKQYDGGGTHLSEGVGRYHDKMYLHIQRVAGTWSYWFSHDGVSWFSLGAPGTSLVVAYIDISLASYGAGGKRRLGIGWVRRDWLFL